MVQWTETPPPRIATDEPEPSDDIAPRPRRMGPPRKRSSKALLQVVVICSIFALILASYTLFSYVPNTTAQAIREPGPVPARDAGAGRIIVSGRENCREFGFDNHSGQTVAKGAIACGNEAGRPGDPASHSAYRHPTNRLDAIRRSFTPQ